MSRDDLGREMWLGGSARLRPSSGLTAATIIFHTRCAAQRFVTPGCCLSIHLLNDCPFLQREGHFSTLKYDSVLSQTLSIHLALVISYLG